MQNNAKMIILFILQLWCWKDLLPISFLYVIHLLLIKTWNPKVNVTLLERFSEWKALKLLTMKYITLSVAENGR